MLQASLPYQRGNGGYGPPNILSKIDMKLKISKSTKNEGRSPLFERV